MITRRGFLKSGGLALVSMGLGGVPTFVVEAAKRILPPTPFVRKKILICIFQRGAMDGLMAVSPYTDPYLVQARPSLFISPARQGNNPSLIDLDGRFGMHPSLSPFANLFNQKQLAVVHGIGSPNNSRSHFDAQDYMESGTPFSKSTPTGWLNRAVGIIGHDALTPFQAVSLTSSLPRSFYGPNPTMAISNLQDFAIQMNGNPAGANLAAQSFEDLYDQTSAGLLKNTGKESFEAMKILKNTDTRNYKPNPKAIYTNSPLSNSLKQLAQLVKMNVGLEVGFAESGGWDTHYAQGAQNGIFARVIDDFSKSITALWNDLDAYQDDVIIMTMTEFGRTVKENGTGGTDHGRGSCNFILGNNILGGKVHGKVETLATENLEDGRDLPVTTDFRTVFSEVTDGQFRIHGGESLFPGFSGSPMGIMKG
jgi:uncharacterized protein (DUF1501 family)